MLLINIVCGEAIYRNKIVGHNIINTPELTFDINEADFVISQYEDLSWIIHGVAVKVAESHIVTIF